MIGRAARAGRAAPSRGDPDPKAKTLRTSAYLLNISPQEADGPARGTIYDLSASPTIEEALIETGLNAGPTRFRSATGWVAQADVTNARAQRFSDVYLLYQPYTMQNNNWQGLKNAYSWTLGVTVSLPVFNRNQGNIMRSKLNAEQSKLELAYAGETGLPTTSPRRSANLDELHQRDRVQERSAAGDDQGAIRPSSAGGGETSRLEHLERSKTQSNDSASASIAMPWSGHRRAMLDVNTPSAPGSSLDPDLFRPSIINAGACPGSS